MPSPLGFGLRNPHCLRGRPTGLLAVCAPKPYGFAASETACNPGCRARRWALNGTRNGCFARVDLGPQGCPVSGFWASQVPRNCGRGILLQVPVPAFLAALACLTFPCQCIGHEMRPFAGARLARLALGPRRCPGAAGAGMPALRSLGSNPGGSRERRPRGLCARADIANEESASGARRPSVGAQARRGCPPGKRSSCASAAGNASGRQGCPPRSSSEERTQSQAAARAGCDKCEA